MASTSATAGSELADKAEARIGDCLSAFTLPHWMMALAATGRDAAAQRMLEAMRAFAQRATARVAPLVARLCAADLRGGAGACARRARRRVALMRPALGGMYRLGGSHAQQDVLEQLFLDAAMKADCTDDVRRILEKAGRGRRSFQTGRLCGGRALRQLVSRFPKIRHSVRHVRTLNFENRKDTHELSI